MEKLREFVSSAFDPSNPYFSAGFGLVGVASGVAVLRTTGRYATLAARRHLLVTLEVNSRDASYPWVLQWIGARKGSTQHFSVATYNRQADDGGVRTHFDLMPSPGTHYFQHGVRWFMVERTRERGPGDLQSGSPFETATLTTVGRSREPLERILEEARAFAERREEGRTAVYTAWGSDWRQFGAPRRRRPLDSVILDRGAAELLMADLQDFLASPRWYVDRGIPYRRGYLLYGPPGCGKSSFIMALAGELGFNICLINLGDKGLSDDRLGHLMASAPRKSFIVLEDIDAAFTRGVTARDPAAEQSGYGAGVTFSGLLNVLDGVAATEERIVFMTTNHINRLDPALVRPGRADVKHYIGMASPHQLDAIFARFYPSVPGLAPQFSAALSEHDVSMAQVQGFLMRYKGQPRLALDNVSEIFTMR